MSPIKEPHFFTFEGEAPIFNGPGGHYFRRHAVQRRLDYLLLFAAVTKERAIGEVSPSYLFSTFAASRIKKNYPDSKIVVLLRQPADRAYSRYQYNRFHLLEHEHSFNKALELESFRKKEGWLPVFFYKEEGYYFSHLRRYFELFPREQIKIYLFEELNESPSAVLKDLFSFLDVDVDFLPILRRKNVTRVQRTKFIHSLALGQGRVDHYVRRLLPDFMRRQVISAAQIIDNRYNLTPPPTMDPAIRSLLTEAYRDDIVKLQDLIGRDLSNWFEPE